MKLRVRGELCFVRPDAMPAMSADGLLHLVHEGQSSSKKGVVVAIGDGPVTAKGVRLPHVVTVGDRVIFPPDAGDELTFEQETLVCLRETDILAVIGA